MEEIYSYNFGSQPTCVKFSPCGEYFVVGNK